jgi:hypothetical protein
MSFPCGSRQSIAFAQTVAMSDGTIIGTPLDGRLLGLTLRGK